MSGRRGKAGEGDKKRRSYTEDFSSKTEGTKRKKKKGRQFHTVGSLYEKEKRRGPGKGKVGQHGRDARHFYSLKRFKRRGGEKGKRCGWEVQRKKVREGH